MYNLIVSSRKFDLNLPHSIPIDRFLEFTDEPYLSSLVQNNALLCSLPTLFMTEGDEGHAYLGKIHSIQKTNKECILQYSFSHKDPIPNIKIKALSSSLQIERFEFSRTHWAVKSPDLYKILYENSGDLSSFKPTVFNLKSSNINEKLLSVMMPFDSSFTPVYSALQEMAKNLGKECKRADDVWKNPNIMQDVVDLICEASVVICDLTGKNANVFYETGIAHCLGKEVILITQRIEDVPFDIKHLRVITYLNNTEGISKLITQIRKRIENL